MPFTKDEAILAAFIEEFVTRSGGCKREDLDAGIKVLRDDIKKRRLPPIEYASTGDRISEFLLIMIRSKAIDAIRYPACGMAKTATDGYVYYYMPAGTEYTSFVERSDS